MFVNRSISRIFSVLLNVLMILSMLIGSSAFPTRVNATSSTFALAGQSKLQVVTFAPLADACTDSCAQTQTTAIASCNANYDPVLCAGDIFCEIEITQQRDSCIADANTAYNSCTATCVVPPVSCTTCAQTQTDAIALCNASLDPAILCGGDPVCEAEVTTARDSCIADANTAYNACTATCVVPPPSCTDSCAATQTDAIAACNAIFDPILGCAVDDSQCIVDVAALHDQCIADANTAYNSCAATCVVPPPSCTTCAQTQMDTIAACYASLDPATICGGDVACEAQIITLRDQCIADANTAYSASGACTNIGGTFTLGSGPNTCTVSYDQAGNANYNSAPQVTEVVTVLSPQQGTVAISNDIQTLITTGAVTSGNGNALISKLDSAIQALNSGNTTSGVNKLDSFINQVKAMIKTGKLTPAEGQILIDAAQAIINSV